MDLGVGFIENADDSISSLLRNNVGNAVPIGQYLIVAKFLHLEPKSCVWKSLGGCHAILVGHHPT